MTVRGQERARPLYRPLLAAKTTDPCNKVTIYNSVSPFIIEWILAGSEGRPFLVSKVCS